MQSILRQAPVLRNSVLPGRRVAVSFNLRRPQNFRTFVTKRYTAEHEAVVFDDSTGLGTVYITDHAQSSLGDVVFVELPTKGTQVKLGEQVGAVESVKAASDIYAPVSGLIEEINEQLASEPGLLNKSPEDRGWLCKIKLSDSAEMEQLLTAEQYNASLE